MPRTFSVGDHVRWNSEAGRVGGTIIKKITSDTRIKGYVRHASKDAPQYLIKSDKTDHVAIHKGSALRLVGTRKKSRQKGCEEVVRKRAAWVSARAPENIGQANN